MEGATQIETFSKDLVCWPIQSPGLEIKTVRVIWHNCRRLLMINILTTSTKK